MNYCMECGAALVQARGKVNHYDPEWGSPRYVFTRACPRRSFFRSKHTKVTTIARDEQEADMKKDFEWHSGWD